jgi:two-component system, sensor histidine kinase and response regulator
MEECCPFQETENSCATLHHFALENSLQEAKAIIRAIVSYESGGVMIPGNLPLVLSVDDEKANLALLERVLGGCYRVISVTNGQDALNMLAQAPFDLVLLDIMMPVMDGLQTLQRIRSHPETADIPVILVSGLADGHNISRGLESGANDYITKPMDVDVLSARVQTQVWLKQLQDQRKQTIVELREAQEMKNRFLRIASHDLKGPLSNIRMATDLLSRTPDDPRLLPIIEESVDAMQTLIQDFLDTAALETGLLDLRLDNLALDQVITHLVAEHNMSAVRKNIALQVLDMTGMIRADMARFPQALGNLISNAIKYSPTATTVKVWTERDENSVSIYVADQGPGIPIDEQSKLFTPFGKLTPRPTGGESSTGLGLWIVKHLIGLQNGEVGLISPAEGGSIFWIRMPAA